LKDRATQRLLLLVIPVCLLLFSSNSQAQDHAIKSQYIRQTSKESVIVFVHGVLGDAKETWTNDKTKVFWPNLIKEDPLFNRFDIYVYSYSSPFRGAAYTVDELAEDMRRDLDSADIFRKHKEVVFICHSLGGIVVRAFLTRYQTQALKVPMIYFFSTPTTGAQIAELGRLLSNNPQLGTLLPMGSANDYLESIQKDWLAANFSIASYCAYETQDTFGVRVVGVASATNLCNRRLDPINANHFDIVKPRDRSDVPYVSFRNAVRELQERTTTKNIVPPSSGAKETTPPIQRTAKFAVMIPFDSSPDSSPIPLDENPDDPLYRTYAHMVSLAMNGTVPETARDAQGEGQISWQAKSISMQEAPAFLGKLLQYYVFQCIDNLQRNSLTVSVGYPAQASAGIEPPNAAPYPYEKLSRELADNVFFRPFLHRPSGDEMAWKVKSVSMPKGTEIRFSEMPDKYLVSFHRPGHFTVDFIVESFVGTGVGQVPKHFVTPHVSTTMQWTFFVTMRYAIEHSDDRGFNPSSYAQWLDAIYDGLHKQLAADY
jgi:pimeloyl-ACP methyl ester carboxylesterase